MVKPSQHSMREPRARLLMQAHQVMGGESHMLRQRTVRQAGPSRAVLHHRLRRAVLRRVWASQRSRLGELQTGATIRRQAQTSP